MGTSSEASPGGLLLQYLSCAIFCDSGILEEDEDDDFIDVESTTTIRTKKKKKKTSPPVSPPPSLSSPPTPSSPEMPKARRRLTWADSPPKSGELSSSTPRLSARSAKGGDSARMSPPAKRDDSAPVVVVTARRTVDYLPAARRAVEPVVAPPKRALVPAARASLVSFDDDEVREGGAHFFAVTIFAAATKLRTRTVGEIRRILAPLTSAEAPAECTEQPQTVGQQEDDVVLRVLLLFTKEHVDDGSLVPLDAVQFGHFAWRLAVELRADDLALEALAARWMCSMSIRDVARLLAGVSVDCDEKALTSLLVEAVDREGTTPQTKPAQVIGAEPFVDLLACVLREEYTAMLREETRSENASRLANQAAADEMTENERLRRIREQEDEPVSPVAALKFGDGETRIAVEEQEESPASSSWLSSFSPTKEVKKLVLIESPPPAPPPKMTSPVPPELQEELGALVTVIEQEKAKANKQEPAPLPAEAIKQEEPPPPPPPPAPLPTTTRSRPPPPHVSAVELVVECVGVRRRPLSETIALFRENASRDDVDLEARCAAVGCSDLGEAPQKPAHVVAVLITALEMDEGKLVDIATRATDGLPASEIAKIAHPACARHSARTVGQIEFALLRQLSNGDYRNAITRALFDHEKNTPARRSSLRLDDDDQS